MVETVEQFSSLLLQDQSQGLCQAWVLALPGWGIAAGERGPSYSESRDSQVHQPLTSHSGWHDVHALFLLLRLVRRANGHKAEHV